MLTASYQGLGQTEFGLSLDQITDIVNKAQNYINIVTGVLNDKALPTIKSRLVTIGNINDAEKPPVAPTTPAPAPGDKPVNLDLQRFIPALDAYIYYRKNKWVLPVGIAGVVLLLGGLGFAVGRRTKRCKVSGRVASV